MPPVPLLAGACHEFHQHTTLLSQQLAPPQQASSHSILSRHPKSLSPIPTPVPYVPPPPHFMATPTHPRRPEPCSPMEALTIQLPSFSLCPTNELPIPALPLQPCSRKGRPPTLPQPALPTVGRPLLFRTTPPPPPFFQCGPSFPYCRPVFCPPTAPQNHTIPHYPRSRGPQGPTLLRQFMHPPFSSQKRTCHNVPPLLFHHPKKRKQQQHSFYDTPRRPLTPATRVHTPPYPFRSPCLIFVLQLLFVSLYCLSAPHLSVPPLLLPSPL